MLQKSLWLKYKGYFWTIAILIHDFIIFPDIVVCCVKKSQMYIYIFRKYVKTKEIGINSNRLYPQWTAKYKENFIDT